MYDEINLAESIKQNSPMQVSDSVMANVFPEKPFGSPDNILSSRQRIEKFCKRNGFEYEFDLLDRSHWFKK